MSFYNAVHNATVLVISIALAWVTVVSAGALVTSIRDGDTSRAWVAAIVFLLALLVDVWFFWRLV